jgi:hypothetical protein
MTDTPPPDPQPPTTSSRPPIIEAKRGGDVWTTEQLDQLELRDGQPSLRRSLMSKMFDIGPWGWVKLTMLCLAVGAVLRIANVNPFEPGFTLGSAVASLGRGVGNLLLWIIANGWAPALIGVAVVMPIWLLWRLLSVPFRK